MAISVGNLWENLSGNSYPATNNNTDNCIQNRPFNIETVRVKTKSGLTKTIKFSDIYKDKDICRGGYQIVFEEPVSLLSTRPLYYKRIWNPNLPQIDGVETVRSGNTVMPLKRWTILA